jgi:carbon storage regulator
LAILDSEYKKLYELREATLLVLTRRTRQSIMIGDEIELSVLSVSGEKVRIGIDAPDHVPIFRKEVYLRIKGEDASSNGARQLQEMAAPRSAR